MANHIKFIQGFIHKPVYMLKHELYDKTNRYTEVRIANLASQTIADTLNPSKSILLYRIFVTSRETRLSGYDQVGWVLNDDISYCMLCSVPFSSRVAAHHCKACGNIFCSNCAGETAKIVSLEHVGPLRVCKVCYYGQVSHTICKSSFLSYCVGYW